MIKKILVGTLLASAVTVASANTAAPYVGAGLGVNVNTSSSGVNTFFTRTMPVSIFAGYGGVVNQNFYLAGEFTGVLGAGELTSKGNSVKTTYGYGLSVLPGLMLSDHTLAFARVGFVRSRFTNMNTYGNGGQIGLGLQTSLTQNVDVRGEYDFTAYKTVSNVGAPRSDAASVSLVYKFD